MKTTKFFYLSLFLVFSLACSSDEEPLAPIPLPVTMEFPADLHIMEEAADHEIFINFNRPATTSGSIFVKLKTGHDIPFETTPPLIGQEMEIDVRKGDTRASFFLKPEENGLMEGNKDLVFELIEGTEGFLLGNKKLLNITIIDDEQAAKADFSTIILMSIEDNPDATYAEIDILGEAPGEGTLEIKVEGDAVSEFLTTVPPLDENNVLELPVSAGASRVQFEIVLKNDQILKAHQNFTFKMVRATGAVVVGDLNSMSFTLLDDELYGRAKSLETVTSAGKTIKTITYDASGRISTVKIESYTPDYYGKVDTYSYNGQGQLEFISSFPGDVILFHYENGKVVKTEELQGFFVTGYSLLEYNASGKISKKTNFEKKPDGEDIPKTMQVYTYHSDGNLKTEVSYIPSGNNSWKQETSHTYSNYDSKFNPFPLEIIPGHPVQHNFPGAVEVEHSGSSTSYSFANEYNFHGFIITRESPFESYSFSYY